jgi:hypothetical protein
MGKFAFITVEKGDIVGMTSRGKPYREYNVEYKLVEKAGDLGLAPTPHMSSGSMSKMIEEARSLAKKFRNKSIYSQIQVIGCGNFNGKWLLADDGRFYKV